LFRKPPSKAELSRLLQARCEHALLLDNTISTTYAAQPVPSKRKYRQRKAQPDIFAQEVERLQKEKESEPAPPESSNAAELNCDVDVGSLEREVAVFMRSRGRK